MRLVGPGSSHSREPETGAFQGHGSAGSSRVLTVIVVAIAVRGTITTSRKTSSQGSQECSDSLQALSHHIAKDIFQLITKHNHKF